MRRISKLATAAVLSIGAVAAGCGVPPGGGGTSLACDSSPVDLGTGDSVRGISVDGRTIVLADYRDDGTVGYSAVDRSTGQRREFLVTSPLGDGASIHLDDAGHRILSEQYPEFAPGVERWNLFDLRTGISEPVIPGLSNEYYLEAISSTLDRAVAQDWAAPGQPLWIADTTSGELLAPVAAAPPGWFNGGFSPDLSLMAQRSLTVGGVQSIRVVSVATGQVVRDVGQVRVESNPMGIGLRFLDDDSLLVPSSEPATAPSDGIADDGAFVVRVSSGAITRIDPGVPRAFTLSSSPDGRTSIFGVTNQSGRWIRKDGVNRPLETYLDVSRDHSIGVEIADGHAWLHCL